MKLFINILLTIILIVGQLLGFNVEDSPLFDDVEFTSSEISALADYENLAADAEISAAGLTDGEYMTGVTVRKGDSLYLEFDQPITCDSIVLQETLNRAGTTSFPLEGGTKQFSIYASLDGEEKLIYRNDKIDTYRLCTFPDVTCDALRIQFDDCRLSARINEIGVYDVQKVQRDFRINDYYVYEGEAPNASEKFQGYLDTVTDLTLFIGVGINANGEVTYSPDKAAVQERFANLREAIGDRDIKLYANVFSADADGETFFKNSKELAKNLASFVTEFDIEGVDFDWEYPNTLSDWDAYNQLALDLRAEFDKVGKKFSFTSTEGNMKFSDKAKQAVDYFNVMIYDQTSSDYDGYHSTFKQTVSAIERLYYKGYDPQKICLGFPYYARDIKNGNNDKARWFSYESSGIKDRWTNVATMPVQMDDGTVTMQKGYFNGYAMIRDKTAYAIDMSLGGVMTWHTMYDMPIENPLSLHRAVIEACEQRLE